MRRGSSSRLFKGLLAVAALSVICAIPLALISYFASAEHVRRVDVIRSGKIASATVFESSSPLRGSCAFAYKFSANRRVYTGGDGGCRLVDNHPVGSSLTVRFDPSDPGNSVAEGGDLWPGWTVVPLLISLPLLVLAIIAIYAVFRNAFQRPKRSRRSERH
jgi:hypothetical protein